VSTTFADWLRRQTHRRDPVGDLARDYVAPCPCALCEGRPGSGTSPAELRTELADHGACEDAYAALRWAVSEWRADAELRKRCAREPTAEPVRDPMACDPQPPARIEAASSSDGRS
jgi:hypothetical protein